MHGKSHCQQVSLKIALQSRTLFKTGLALRQPFLIYLCCKFFHGVLFGSPLVRRHVLIFRLQGEYALFQAWPVQIHNPEE